MRRSFEALVANYAGAQATLHYVNAALTIDEPGLRTIYAANRCDTRYVGSDRMPKGCIDGWDESSLITSLNESFVEAFMGWLTEGGADDVSATDVVSGHVVAALTWGGLLDAHGVSALGFLIVDAETQDCRLVRAFPFDRVVPDVIVFEVEHCAAGEYDALHRFLVDDLGYAAAPGFVGHAPEDACYVQPPR
ncbi:hypothetical protein M885DRAFT_519749 [Pelagophyceae sp. CCMP2097]|nr:hypothetical protein M885DRAFT_519749 [Pelagophyceae sp. CCMP2097]